MASKISSVFGRLFSAALRNEMVGWRRRYDGTLRFICGGAKGREELQKRRGISGQLRPEGCCRLPRREWVRARQDWLIVVLWVSTRCWVACVGYGDKLSERHGKIARDLHLCVYIIHECIQQAGLPYTTPFFGLTVLFSLSYFHCGLAPGLFRPFLDQK